MVGISNFIRKYEPSDRVYQTMQLQYYTMNRSIHGSWKCKNKSCEYIIYTWRRQVGYISRQTDHLPSNLGNFPRYAVRYIFKFDMCLRMNVSLQPYPENETDMRSRSHVNADCLITPKKRKIVPVWRPFKFSSV